jgi:hypothetical protein
MVHTGDIESFLGHRPFTAVTRVRIPLGARSTAVKVLQIQMQGFKVTKEPLMFINHLRPGSAVG